MMSENTLVFTPSIDRIGDILTGSSIHTPEASIDSTHARSSRCIIEGSQLTYGQKLKHFNIISAPHFRNAIARQR